MWIWFWSLKTKIVGRTKLSQWDLGQFGMKFDEDDMIRLFYRVFSGKQNYFCLITFISIVLLSSFLRNNFNLMMKENWTQLGKVLRTQYTIYYYFWISILYKTYYSTLRNVVMNTIYIMYLYFSHFNSFKFIQILCV